MNFVFKEALQGLGRNLTMTIALVITTAISLALLATGFLFTSMTERTKEIYLDRVEVMVELDETISAKDPDCSSPACREVYDALNGAQGVASVTFKNREESYRRFVEVFKDSNPALVQETSPEALFAALHVRLTDPLDTTPLDKVRNMDQVDSIIDQGDDLRDATHNLDSIRNATFVVAVIQAIASLFLIVNMVQIAAYSRREEVSIMRMVGASRWYTNFPFILEAVFAAVLGSVFAIAGLFTGKRLVVDEALRPLYESRLIAPITDADIWVTAPVVAVIGIAFAAATAQLTLRLYVRA
ncbi:permease-like cell division protein FtsX [Corynebacterium mendelii]|uniref:permease-like cell division protein FtsX n=1 Tax=Corynebacterium mendelii TaxID=2765362 RepID=UPI002ED5B38F